MQSEDQTDNQPSPKTVYTFGYEKRHVAELLAEVKRLGAAVIDTRLNPQSRVDEWSKGSLERLLDHDYLWVGAFGNLNYKHPELGIRIANSREGLMIAEVYSLSEIPMILLCYERDPNRCHRNDVAKMIADAFGLQIEHLLPDGSQRSMF